MVGLITGGGVVAAFGAGMGSTLATGVTGTVAGLATSTAGSFVAVGAEAATVATTASVGTVGSAATVVGASSIAKAAGMAAVYGIGITAATCVGYTGDQCQNNCWRAALDDPVLKNEIEDGVGLDASVFFAHYCIRKIIHDTRLGLGVEVDDKKNNGFSRIHQILGVYNNSSNKDAIFVGLHVNQQSDQMQNWIGAIELKLSDVIRDPS